MSEASSKARDRAKKIAGALPHARKHFEDGGDASGPSGDEGGSGAPGDGPGVNAGPNGGEPGLAASNPISIALAKPPMPDKDVVAETGDKPLQRSGDLPKPLNQQTMVMRAGGRVRLGNRRGGHPA